jgi:group I intron endonuclease
MAHETPTKNNRIHYLYRITNKINGKFYIGQTVQPSKRWNQHRRDAANPTMIIHHAIKKYGNEAFEFEIIAECKTWDDANELETLLVTQYNSLVPSGYNVSLGGMNAPKTEAWRQQMRDRWADPEYKTNVGQAISQAHATQTPEEKIATAKLISETLQGRHLSPQTEFKEGHQPSFETIEKTASKLRGVPRPDLQGIPLTQETRDKISQSKMGSIPWNKDTKGICEPNSGSFRLGHQSCFKGITGRLPNHRKLTDENVLEIVYMMINKLKTKEELAEQFSVKERVIRDIMAGRTWNHVTHI